ncbi:hypothetical protein MMC19_000473 [Ptychographa xylographoides]|nr:hypothetical protein [Ptychographa xylographoides]
MKAHQNLSKDVEANAAASEALKGAAVGAAKYGLPLLLLPILGPHLSPIYRGLTIQFKVFIQMSGMTLGGMIEADRRIRDYEARVRIEKRRAKDAAAWQRFEEGYRESMANEGPAKRK